MIFSILLGLHRRSGSELRGTCLLQLILIYGNVVIAFGAFTLLLAVLLLLITILNKIVLLVSVLCFEVSLVLAPYWIKAIDLCPDLNADSWKFRSRN